MEEFNNELFDKELFEDTMLESEKNYTEYAKIYSDFKDDLSAIQTVDNADVRARLLVNLQKKYINKFIEANKIGDSSLIDTYKDILVELGADDYVLDDYQVNNGGKQK